MFVSRAAIDAMAKVSSGAFKLFCYLSRHRSKENVFLQSAGQVAEGCGIALQHLSLLRAELIEKGWIAEAEGGGLVVLMTEEKNQEPLIYINNNKYINTDLESNNKPITKVNNNLSKNILAHEKKSKTETKRGKRIPTDFTVTTDMREWARLKCPNVDIDLETEKFINYWSAKTGVNATKLDWKATWRNWLLSNLTKYGTPTESGTRKSNIDKLRDYEALFEKYE